MHTIEEAKQWAAENREQLERDRHACQTEAVRFLNRLNPALMADLWNSGCWLKETLLAAGAEEDQARHICFTHGRMCVGNCPWHMAVTLANAWDKVVAESAEPN
jgi:hypothetical protein